MMNEKVLTLRGKKAVWAPAGVGGGGVKMYDFDAAKFYDGDETPPVTYEEALENFENGIFQVMRVHGADYNTGVDKTFFHFPAIMRTVADEDKGIKNGIVFGLSMVRGSNGVFTHVTIYEDGTLDAAIG